MGRSPGTSRATRRAGGRAASAGGAGGGPLRAASWARDAETRWLLRAQGRARGPGRAAGGADRGRRRGAEPFLHPGRGAPSRSGARRPAGWASCTRQVAPGWDLPGGAAFEIDLARLVGASGAGLERYEDVTGFPAVLQDLAVVVAEEVPAESGAGGRARGRRRAAAAPPRSSTSTTATRSARAQEPGASAASSRAGPDPHRRGGAPSAREAIAAEIEKLGGRCVSEQRTRLTGRPAAARRRAAGPGAGRRRHRLHRGARGTARLAPPAAWSWPRPPPARQAGRRLDELDPRPGCRSRWRARTWRRLRASTPRSWRCRTAPRRTSWPSCARAASRWSTSRRTSACATSRPTSAGTEPTTRPSSLREAAYGLTELARERVAGAELVANPGCYPTAALLALAPLAEAGLCEEIVIDAKSGVSGAGRGGVDFAEIAENFKPYGVEGHRHAPRDRAGASRAGRSARRPFRPAPAADRPGPPCELLRDPHQGDRLGRAAGASTRRATRASRSCELTAAAPGVRDVRDTNRARVHVALDERIGAHPRVLRDRQPLEGRVRAGAPEPEPDAGPGRDRGADVSATTGCFPALAVGRASAGGGGAGPRGAGPGFRAAGVACGLKAARDGRGTGRLRRGGRASSALLLTRNAAAAAPDSRLPRRGATPAGCAPRSSTRGTRTPPPASRAIATRSRCATPRRAALGLEPRGVAVAETGTIGVPLPVGDVIAGIGRAAGQLVGHRGRQTSPRRS